MWHRRDRHRPRRAVAKNRASCTAPCTLRKPAPCSSGLVLGAVLAVYCRMALTAFGVSAGLACSIIATVPLTAGAAMLVPVSVR